MQVYYRGLVIVSIFYTLTSQLSEPKDVFFFLRQLIFTVGKTNKSLGINHWEIPSVDKDVIHYFIVLFIATIESGIYNK